MTNPFSPCLNITCPHPDTCKANGKCLARVVEPVRYRGYSCASGNHKLCDNPDCECECHELTVPSEAKGGTIDPTFRNAVLDIVAEVFKAASQSDYVSLRVCQELRQAALNLKKK